jgi:hypothetical protein
MFYTVALEENFHAGHQGEWVEKIYLNDVYLNIPVHRHHLSTYELPS